MSKPTILVIGAGPAGLTAAYLLAKEGYSVTVLESDPHYVGGLSKTIKKGDFRLDIGGHRFFTKEKQIQQFWRGMLGKDMLIRRRLSRIFYKKIFLSYPLNPSQILTKLSPLESLAIMGSYALSLFRRSRPVENYEDWIIKHFGKRLYQTFFQSYTEKVWGMDCREISADWASQRINNLNIASLVKSTLQGMGLYPRSQQEIKSLIEEFEYPLHGPGMLWERVRERFEQIGGTLLMNQRVHRVERNSDGEWLVYTADTETPFKASELISSAPLGPFLRSLGPLIPTHLHHELAKFTYRAFVTVALMFESSESFEDNWIYIHDSRVKVARIQNYGNWSPGMVPDGPYVCYGLEYFCQEDDAFWKLSDQELIELAQQEVQILKLPFPGQILDAHVVRSPKAYPVYDLEYVERLNLIRDHLKTLPNLHLVGRAGLHRYNNQDHSIKTAMLTVKNIKSASKQYDPWQVNQDAEYIERSQS